METGEVKISGGSGKTSKKGGKRIKQPTAEEEARRREELKEKLREKFELERRAVKVVERLLEDSVTEDFLLDCAKLMTPANYKDTIEERFIAKMCGYPICSDKLVKIPTQKYKISTKTNRVYDITERKCFCSNFCYKASKEFELQISKTPLWVRQFESPQEIRLLKKGDSGSSGEEVMLSVRHLKKEDIENPPDDLCGESSVGAGHAENTSDEQDFVSSVVSQQQRPRVHWGDLPKSTDRGKSGVQEKAERRDKQNTGILKEEPDSQTTEREPLRGKSKRKEPFVEKSEEFHEADTDQAKEGEKELSVEEATVKLNLCSLSEHTTTQAGLTTTVISLPVIEAQKTENHPSPSPGPTPTNPSNLGQAWTSPPGLSITQVGMSKRGAAGLRHLLETHGGKVKPASFQPSICESLRRTLKEWCTDETRRFLYGSGHSPSPPSSADPKEAEEELDEDDFENDENVLDGQGLKRPLTAAPAYETLQKETQQLELRVREFYKGTWILPREDEPTVQEEKPKDPVLPLIDSQAQHLIQKRIAVERLSGCLRSILGSLPLTMSDVSTDLNNLVKTFRLTSKNIIHKTPEWTLIAVVLLHLLSEVSPLVREALETSASVEYLNTLMQELGLQEQDLLQLVQEFKSPTH
ncbi:unnamed protein product [Menidia menidia]|uniref:RNA polymerase II subunit B1 CTD phosphatase RPAP2 homolog n=1 Tax=Menidia menidia TaxID=238744 RepID=A0A8S4AVG5_9TELE|nr:unnamed protein product [Menidia menidia]